MIKKIYFFPFFFIIFSIFPEKAEQGKEFGQLQKVPISLITISNYNIPNVNPSFKYLPNKINKFRRIDLDQIKGIEEIYLIDDKNFDDTKKEHTEKNLGFSYLFLDKNFISAFKKFINSEKFNKQIIGFKKEDNKISLFAVNKSSNFIEKNLLKSFKKTNIYNRQGQKVEIELKVKFLRFSKHKLKKDRLNGVIGLLTNKGRKKLEDHLEIASITVAQATLINKSDKKNFGAKGTIGIPVSPIQNKLVNNAKDIDLIINLEELNAFENNKLPPDGSTMILQPGTISIMRTMEHLPKKKGNFSIMHLLHLINNKEIINIHKKIWNKQIDSAIKKYKDKKISQGALNKSLAKLSYYCELPRYSRYLWADESLKIHEAIIPQSLAKDFPIGEKILILSHPLLFTLNYAVVEIKGYTESEAFVLNPELSNRLLRDQDGDIISIVPPKSLPLNKIHIPSKNVITTKKEYQNDPLTNDKIIDLIFNDEYSNIRTMNTLIDLYIHILENKRFDLFEKHKLNLARYYQACLDRNKKGTNPRYSSKNLDKLTKLIYLKIYKTEPKAEQKDYSIPPHQTYKTLKTLGKIAKKEEFGQKTEKVNSLISSPTNINFLKDIWQHILSNEKINEQDLNNLQIIL